MVLILAVNSEIGAHVMINLCYFICFRQLMSSRAVIILRKDHFSFMRVQHALSYHLITMATTLFLGVEVFASDLRIRFADPG